MRRVVLASTLAVALCGGCPRSTPGTGAPRTVAPSTGAASAVTPSAVAATTVAPSAVAPSTVTASAVTPSAVAPSTGTPSTVTAPSAPAPTAGASDGSERDDEAERCYPYQPRADGSCKTECARIDDCQGSRGPADFAEHGWPLDCINRKCVPLPPERVNRH